MLEAWPPGVLHWLAWALAAAVLLLPLLRRWTVYREVLRSTVLMMTGALGMLALAALVARFDNPTASALCGSLARLLAGWALIRATGLALFRELLPSAGMRPARILEDMLVVAGYAMWSLVQLREAGVDPSSLVTSSAVVTAVAAFAMQDTLGNLLGGLFLELGESFHLGDWVKVDDLSGRVEQIRWRHTAIRTRNGELVIVPNSVLMRTRFQVLGNPDTGLARQRRWVCEPCHGRRGAPGPVALAEGMVANAEIANVLATPAPSCVLMDMGPGHLHFALRYWLADPGPDDPTDSAVRLLLLATLRRHGVALAAPEQRLLAYTDSPARARAVEEADLERRRAALRRMDLFAALSAEEIATLATRLVPAPFAAGEVMTREGAVAHWLYLIDRGAAEVVVSAAGKRQTVATIEAGGFFGEMALLTGAPRRATVVARTDVECFRLDKASFESILRARPVLAEHLSQTLLRREEELTRSLANASASPPPLTDTRDSLVSRILGFFGLAENA